MSAAEHFPGRGISLVKSNWQVRAVGYHESMAFDATLEVGDVLAEIWRTDPVLSGSQNDIFGLPAGPPHSDIVISNSNVRIQPHQNPPPEGTRKVMAEIHSLQIEQDGYRILVGEPLREHLRSDPRLTAAGVAKIFRRSYGELVSRNESGDQNKDFPADGFFNIFLGLVVPMSVAGTELTLYNRDPLPIVDQESKGFPPFRNRVISTDEPLDVYFVIPPVVAQSAVSQEPVEGGSLQIELESHDVDPAC